MDLADRERGKHHGNYWQVDCKWVGDSGGEGRKVEQPFGSKEETRLLGWLWSYSCIVDIVLSGIGATPATWVVL